MTNTGERKVAGDNNPIFSQNYIFGLIPDNILEQLIENGSKENSGKDHVPLVKLNFYTTGYTWLISELNPDKPNVAYGFRDFDTDMAVETFDLNELANLEGPIFEVFRKATVFTKKQRDESAVFVDLNFEGRYPLSTYIAVSKEVGCMASDERFNREAWFRHTNSPL